MIQVQVNQIRKVNSPIEKASKNKDQFSGPAELVCLN